MNNCESCLTPPLVVPLFLRGFKGAEAGIADVDAIPGPSTLVWKERLDLRIPKAELGLLEQSSPSLKPVVEVVALGLVAVEVVPASELMMAPPAREPLLVQDVEVSTRDKPLIVYVPFCWPSRPWILLLETSSKV